MYLNLGWTSCNVLFNMPRTWTCHMQMISNAQTIEKSHYNAPFAEYFHIFEIVTNICYFSYFYKSFNYRCIKYINIFYYAHVFSKKSEERGLEKERVKRKLNPNKGNDWDTTCIGHECPCDTFCILNLGIDQIKQNASIVSFSLRIKFRESYIFTRTNEGKIWTSRRIIQWHFSSLNESFFGTISIIYMTRYNQTV